MINFEKYKMQNGLTVILHQDMASPTAVVNILYNVGSRNETEDKTGFAHLFEHLMFEGSENIPTFDEPLQRVGGQNNAFTSQDITNYYTTVPSANLDTALWLESDRMKQLAFSEDSLEIQKKVVIEEFNQRYLNQPYGNIWLHIWPLVYKQHPYRWPTIGKEIAHVADAKLDYVKSFFSQYYNPSNAILVLAGNFEVIHAKTLLDKYFSTIASGITSSYNPIAEPDQTEYRRQDVSDSVPLHAIMASFRIPGKNNAAYITYDLLGDCLGQGKSSVLYQQLVKEQKIFQSISVYNTGSREDSILIVDAKVNKEIELEAALSALNHVLDKIVADGISDAEVERVRNKALTSAAFSRLDVLNKAMSLAFYEWLGNADDINKEGERIEAVTTEMVNEALHSTFRQDNRSDLIILKAE